jgi:hypothetical protein
MRYYRVNGAYTTESLDAAHIDEMDPDSPAFAPALEEAVTQIRTLAARDGGIARIPPEARDRTDVLVVTTKALREKLRERDLPVNVALRYFGEAYGSLRHSMVSVLNVLGQHRPPDRELGVMAERAVGAKIELPDRER